MRHLRLPIAETLRAAKTLVRDERIPRPIRWGGAFGLLPLPGPLDEVVLVLVAAVLWLFYRREFGDAWASAKAASPGQIAREPPDVQRRTRSRVRTWMWAVIATFALGVTLVIGAKVLGRWHYDAALWALAGWSVPPDFSVFYQAADAVLSGKSPYQLDLPARLARLRVSALARVADDATDPALGSCRRERMGCSLSALRGRGALESRSTRLALLSGRTPVAIQPGRDRVWSHRGPSRARCVPVVEIPRHARASIACGRLFDRAQALCLAARVVAWPERPDSNGTPHVRGDRGVRARPLGAHRLPGSLELSRVS